MHTINRTLHCSVLCTGSLAAWCALAWCSICSACPWRWWLSCRLCAWCDDSSGSMWCDPTWCICSGRDDLGRSWSWDAVLVRRLGMDARPLRLCCEGSNWKAEAGSGWESMWVSLPWDSMRLSVCWEPAVCARIAVCESRACCEALLRIDGVGISGGDNGRCELSCGCTWAEEGLPPLPAEARLPALVAVRAATALYPLPISCGDMHSCCCASDCCCCRCCAACNSARQVRLPRTGAPQVRRHWRAG